MRLRRDIGTEAHDVIQVLATEFTTRLTGKSQDFIWNQRILMQREEQDAFIDYDLHNYLRRTQLLVFLETLPPQKRNIESNNFNLDYFLELQRMGNAVFQEWTGYLIYKGELFFASGAEALVNGRSFHYESRARIDNTMRLANNPEELERHYINERLAQFDSELIRSIGAIETPNGLVRISSGETQHSMIRLASIYAHFQLTPTDLENMIRDVDHEIFDRELRDSVFDHLRYGGSRGERIRFERDLGRAILGLDISIALHHFDEDKRLMLDTLPLDVLHQGLEKMANNNN